MAQTKDEITVPVDYLKKKYLALRVAVAQDFRRDVRKTLSWTKSVWFNKLHGITPLTPAEYQVIKKDIYPKHRNNARN